MEEEGAGAGCDSGLFVRPPGAGDSLPSLPGDIVCLKPVISAFQIASQDREIEINHWSQLHEEGHFDVCFQNQGMID